MSVFNGDGTRGLLELPEAEAASNRDDAYDACHAECVICGAETCAAQLTCACGPAPIPVSRDGLDAACSDACRAEFARGANA